MRAYAIDPVAPGGGFHLRYDGAVGVTLSDEPRSQLGSQQRLSGAHRALFVDMLPECN